MAGEIATAYVALVPSMRNFGSQAVRQIGPQATAIGDQAGRQAGAAFTRSASKESAGWFAQTAQGAIKNVTLYGSMYAAIQAVQKGVGAVLQSMVGFNAEIEQATVGFETLLGSSAAAGEEMQWIKDFAKETPFQYKDLVGYSQQLLALGFNAKQSQDVLQATGDAAAALGRGSDSIQRINLALGQMWTKGKVQSQEMLQLTEAGIGAWQILADGYGTSVAKVQEAVTAGVIKAKDAVPILLEGMNTRFGGLMEKQSQTFSGVLSNIQDTLQQQLAKAGEPLFGALEDQAKEFLGALNDPEVVKTMDELGRFLGKAVGVLATAGKVAYRFRDAIIAVGIAYGASSLLKKIPAGTILHPSTWLNRGMATETISELNALSAASKTAQAASAAAQATAKEAATAAQVAQVAQAKAGMAYARVTPTALAAMNAEVKASIYNYDRWSVATAKLTAAEIAQFEAQQALTRSAPRLVAAQAELTAATEAEAIAATQAAEAEAALAAARKTARGAQVSGALKSFGPVAGLAGLVMGYEQISTAQKNGAKTALGFAEAVGGGALAGLALGGPIGAAAGAVVGLTAAMWSYHQAAEAANKDTTAVQKAMQDLGVDAGIATVALSGITNQQLEAAGGAGALLDAMKAGGYDEYVANLSKQSEALHKQYDTQADALVKYQSDAAKANDTEALLTDEYVNQKGALENLGDKMNNTDALLKSLGGNAAAFSESQKEITTTAYQSAFALDMQTGSLGTMTQAAWNAVQAQGGLDASALNASVRMEGLAGVAGYATKMIAGIPINTPINFSTNAQDVLNKIIDLQAVSRALAGTGIGKNVNDEIKKQQAILKKLLTTSAPTQKLPSYGATPRKSGGGSGSKAKTKSKAQIAAEKAAAKLKEDRAAQRQFGEAFGAVMDAALEGNYDEYKDRLAEQIKKLTEDGYTKAAKVLKEQSKLLTQTAKDYAALTNKLKAATDAYDDLTKSMADQYSASRDQILGLGQATDAQSFDQLAYLLGETTTKANEYQAVLAQLKAQGLSEDLWNQLAQAGPESAALAESILAQGKSGIDQLNSLSTGLVGAAKSMGDLVSQSMYSEGVAAMKAYIDGLNSESEALEAKLVTIGNNVLKKTGVAITPGNHGYSLGTSSAAPTSTVNQYNMTISAESLGDIKSVQDFIEMLKQAPTTQLVNQAGTVTS